jgi:hypothetical protein
MDVNGVSFHRFIQPITSVARNSQNILPAFVHGRVNLQVLLQDPKVFSLLCVIMNRRCGILLNVYTHVEEVRSII